MCSCSVPSWCRGAESSPPSPREIKACTCHIGQFFCFESRFQGTKAPNCRPVPSPKSSVWALQSPGAWAGATVPPPQSAWRLHLMRPPLGHDGLTARIGGCTLSRSKYYPFRDALCARECKQAYSLGLWASGVQPPHPPPPPSGASRVALVPFPVQNHEKIKKCVTMQNFVPDRLHVFWQYKSASIWLRRRFTGTGARRNPCVIPTGRDA